ncbi:MAG: SCO family protein [Ideonella sp. MAG2]|nr:MAG: SCO family protein [Ideonella sp. MAG2]
MRRLILSAALVLAGASLWGCDASKPEAAVAGGFKGVDITGAEYARELSLPDVAGKPRTLAEFKGKVVVVFFGYTQCPDVCPTTLTELAEVRKQLGADGAKVQPIFVSVDPERDTAELLQAYVGNFGADNIALRGSPEQTAAMAKAFKVFYAKVPGKTETSYTVDHTAASYLYDLQGRVRVYSRYGSGPEALAHDIKRLLAGA